VILFAHAQIYFNKSRGPHDCGWAQTGRRSLHPYTVTTGFRMMRIQGNIEKEAANRTLIPVHISPELSSAPARLSRFQVIGHYT
jgi:hypothetical protein